MTSRLFVSVVVAAALATTAASAQPAPAAAPATGCTGNSQLPGDIFAQNTFWPTTGFPAGFSVNIGGGKAMVQSPASQQYGIIYSGQLVSDADICVDLSVASVKNATDPNGPAGAGIVFWQQDWNNFYTVFLDTSASGAIYRWQNNRALALVGWQPVASLKGGAGATNTMRVTLKGNTITTYFNGTLFKSIPSVQPSGGGAFGLWWYSESAGPNTWTFSNLKITDPPAQ
jgi:hypothetical protein